jgi:hypothetical protein
VVRQVYSGLRSLNVFCKGLREMVG